MKIEASFEEIKHILSERVNKDISIRYLEDNKIEISLLTTDLIIKIVEINGHRITINLKTSGIVGKAMILALVSMNSDKVRRIDTDVLEINLAKFHEFFENINIKDISFTKDDTVIIQGYLQ